ncbi:MAG: pyridoxal phosphate-dependent aminotransferase [Clostridium sp.]|jgi:aspartate/methionine/tyrosine aminotransferase|uniref:pyridoxal phosphate-dependent aminotransferase n=1 Tax=Clostridium sp. TaxID=1506 RepID=UPI0025B8D6E2|nr:pyridoxal phosphate-dependent aminotransferase [Clostridium sp.]MCH3965411.1 pyridoxal phosphate-dependent aminotransferase [Clostridium sp.]MCI1717357.1 pyridoxal phosphate-dependent aminotransferase [Clostridium sp.]MCI1801697.1 pyridoxal phosphate-dependent aminotransferase [Clostridium sp.]MCI1815552.1 pyridoxal phosphate-dependent aminotransferase [Clostridium sp.]MCI1872455.1 pyridoxal phosphate-dependent aminotransferase [Clostridium sp.]
MEHRFISKKHWKDAVTIMDESTKKFIKQEDVIDLSLGVPDFITDWEISEKAMEDAKKGHTKYTESAGDPELIREIVKLYNEKYDLAFKSEEIMTVVGACHGAYLSLQAVLDDGDEVIVHAPYFTPYEEQIKMAGGKMIVIDTSEDNEFNIDADKLKSSITPRTKALMLNYPNNPTGAVFDRKLLEEIAQIAVDNDLLVISDEIYDVFDYENKFVPMVSLPGMKERTITLGSFSKGYAMSGWRIGFVIAPDFIINCMKSINENICYSAPSISQRAAIYALRMRKRIQPLMIEEFKNRLNYCYKRINSIEGMSVMKPKAGIYLFPNIKETGMTSLEFSNLLLQEAKVIVIPGTAFGKCGEGHVRIACTVGAEKLKKAFDRIEKVLNKVKIEF